jgi:hypothetical protein
MVVKPGKTLTRVADGGNMLDDDNVVRVLALLVDLTGFLGELLGRLEEERVGSDHVVHDRALGDLLGAELPLRAEVLAVVVAQVVVRRDGERLDPGVDEELGEDRLDLCLTRLEVVAADERLVLLGQLDAAGDKRVLGRTVDERDALEDRGNGKDGRGGDLVVGRFHRGEKVLGGVVDARNNVGVAFSVGRPENDEVVERVGLLERADVGANSLEVGLLVIAGDEVVRTVRLVRGDKVGVYT